VEEALLFEANYFENAWLENKGKQGFELQTLGSQLQYTSYHAAEHVAVSSSKNVELMMLGNFFDCNIQMGIYDADNGSVLVYEGKNNFSTKPLLNKRLDGQVRRIKSIKISNRQVYLIARNNDELLVLAPYSN